MATSQMFATEMSDSNSSIVIVDHSSLLSKTIEVLMLLVALM